MSAPSSVNRPAVTADEAAEGVGDAAAMIVDGGRCRFGKPSTIVRVQTRGRWPGVTVEREGVYDERIIRRMLSWTVLFVCSGNTCRSPMAAALARQMLAQQRGLDPGELEAAGIYVLSAGASATAGAPASDPAVEAMQAEGIDLAGHRSRPITSELVAEADAIYTMTEAHRQAVLALDPTAAEKTARLDPDRDIADPVGADLATYRQTAEQMRHALAGRLKERSP
jgi:protein-tyrosine phosphatase